MHKIKYIWENQDKIQDEIDKLENDYENCNNSHCQDMIIKEISKLCDKVIRQGWDLEI